MCDQSEEGSFFSERSELGGLFNVDQLHIIKCSLPINTNSLLLAGVKSVDIDRKQQKVTVTGYVEAKKVLKQAQSTGKKAEIWPYVPYNVVAHPYIAQVYDKKAPPGHVRNVEAVNVSHSGPKQDEQITSMFSDENPNACSIM